MRKRNEDVASDLEDGEINDDESALKVSVTTRRNLNLDNLSPVSDDELELNRMDPEITKNDKPAVENNAGSDSDDSIGSEITLAIRDEPVQNGSKTPMETSSQNNVNEQKKISVNLRVSVEENNETEGEFQVKPPLDVKFKKNLVKEIIHTVLNDTLSGQKYKPEMVEPWCSSILSAIKDKVKEITLHNYRLVVNVVLGEESVAGVKVSCRCFWDPESDATCSDVFLNDTIFAVATVYAIFNY